MVVIDRGDENTLQATGIPVYFKDQKKVVLMEDLAYLKPSNGTVFSYRFSYFTELIMDWMVADFKKENGIDLSSDKMAMQRVKDAAEKAKKDLSGMSSTEISLPFITQGEDGPIHLSTTLTKAKFEDLISDLVESTLDPVRKAMKDAKLTKNDIDKVLLVGGP